MTRRSTARLALGPVLVVTALAALSGCSGDDGTGGALGDAASSLSSEAACQVAEQTVGAAVREGKQAAADIGSQPGSARTRLEGLRDSLTLTSESLSGAVEDAVIDARDALDDLAAAAKAAVGHAIDSDEVDDATARLTDAGDEVTQAC